MEETVSSDYEGEEVGGEIGEYTENQEILEINENVEAPVKEPVSKLDEDLVIPEASLAKGEDGCENEECECDGMCNYVVELIFNYSLCLVYK